MVVEKECLNYARLSFEKTSIKTIIFKFFQSILKYEKHIKNKLNETSYSLNDAGVKFAWLNIQLYSNNPRFNH